MAYVWSSDLETGNAVIDNQHKQLFSALNKLFVAYRSGRERQGAEETMAFLVEYASKHFSDEEELQQKYGYPEYVTHKRLHAEFRNVVQELVTQLSQNGPTDDLVLAIYTAADAWLVNHIKDEDFKMAAYVQAAKQQNPGV